MASRCRPKCSNLKQQSTSAKQVMLSQPRLETNSCFSSGTQGHQKHGPVMHHLHHLWRHKGQLRHILTKYLAAQLVRFYPTDWMLLYRGKPQQKQDHPASLDASNNNHVTGRLQIQQIKQ